MEMTDFIFSEETAKQWLGNSLLNLMIKEGVIRKVANKTPEEQKLKPVDLSVLIKSGIDCEFSDGLFGEGDIPIICSLKEVARSGFIDNSAAVWANCRPRMNHWHSWQGGECPLPEGLEVEVSLRDGGKIHGFGCDFVWDFGEEFRNGDIIAFKVTSLEDGYCWPWECDNE